ncbi:MAG: hypothetical protein AMXMBFR7_42090 [Planctomycetota bacterium]
MAPRGKLNARLPECRCVGGAQVGRGKSANFGLDGLRKIGNGREENASFGKHMRQVASSLQIALGLKCAH